MKTFKELGLDDQMNKAVEKLGYTQPTDIQQRTIPIILQGKDVIAGSVTGSGKTFAFASGIIQLIQAKKGIQALVLVPTRELAQQVKKAMNDFAKFKNIKLAEIYGGVSYNPQYEDLKNSEVVVATPGRLLDHLEQKTLDLSNLKHIILDEADMMLDMGFIPDVNTIMQACPQEKQVLLFSATMAPEIQHISKRFMKEPVRLFQQEYVDPKKMNQCYYVVPSSLKLSLMVHLLKEETTGLVMIFCNSRRMTESLAKGLRKNNIDAQEIHGGLTQAKRSKIMTDFHKNKVLALICTDVAARGLDIPSVTHVYNYDIPKDPKSYVHRIGRTARAGKEGQVVNILCDRDYDNFNRVIYENSEMKIVEKKRPFLEKIEMPTPNERTRTPQRFASSGNNYARSRAHKTPSQDRSSSPRRFSSRSDGARSSSPRRVSSRSDGARSSDSSPKKFSSQRSSKKPYSNRGEKTPQTKKTFSKKPFKK